jgi:hypothetical protein
VVQLSQSVRPFSGHSRGFGHPDELIRALPTSSLGHGAEIFLPNLFSKSVTSYHSKTDQQNTVRCYAFAFDQFARSVSTQNTLAVPKSDRDSCSKVKYGTKGSLELCARLAKVRASKERWGEDKLDIKMRG